MKLIIEVYEPDEYIIRELEDLLNDWAVTDGGKYASRTLLRPLGARLRLFR
jgi:hypothetical protein